MPTPTKLPHLTWDAAQDDDTGASGLDHYNVYRDGLLVGHTPTTTFDDSSVPSDGSFGYTVTAVDRAGNESLFSRTVIIRYDGTRAAAAARPERRLADAGCRRSPGPRCRDQATGGSAIASYRVYRNGSYIGETAGTSYVDGNVVVSGHQIYTVRALDAAGNVSAPSRALDLIVDLEGPVLDAVSFPAQRSIGAAGRLPGGAARRALAHRRRGDVGLRRRLRDRATRSRHIFQTPGTYTITVQGLGHARQHHGDREPVDPDRDAAGRHQGRRCCG